MGDAHAVCGAFTCMLLVPLFLLLRVVARRWATWEHVAARGLSACLEASDTCAACCGQTAAGPCSRHAPLQGHAAEGPRGWRTAQLEDSERPPSWGPCSWRTAQLKDRPAGGFWRPPSWGPCNWLRAPLKGCPHDQQARMHTHARAAARKAAQGFCQQGAQEWCTAPRPAGRLSPPTHLVAAHLLHQRVSALLPPVHHLRAAPARKNKHTQPLRGGW